MKGKKPRKIIALILALAFATTVPMQGVKAEEANTNVASTSMVTVENQIQDYDELSIKPRTTMFDCEIILAFTIDGLLMDFSTACYGDASVIGVKDIKVQQKVWYGWKTVLTSDGAENLNENVFAYDLLFPDAIKDKTYRVICTHYANVDVYEEFENDTGAFKYTY